MKRHFFTTAVCAALMLVLLAGSTDAVAGVNANAAETVDAKSPDDDSSPVVSVAYAEERLLQQPGAFHEFIVKDSEYQIKAAFSTKATVKDLRVLSLQYEDTDDTGKVTFSAKELYKLAELTPDKPLVVGMVVEGSIPSVGISYVDDSGTEHVYAVTMSGMDDSLLMMEIALKR